jgi:DNA-binding IclR family transcriptional regulator
LGNDRGVPPTGRPAERRLAAVERALRVLDAFLRVRGDAGTSELARLTGINASTVSRTLSTLVDAGYVEHVPDSGRYRLGTHLLALANHVVARLDLRVLGRPHLEQLERELGETATGKVMLAFGPESPLPGPLERFTDRTVVGREALGREIQAVRAQGWARAEGEREPHLNAIAAPVFGAGGELAAILGVQGPDTRFDVAAQDAAVPALREQALALSRALGYAESDVWK